MSTDFEGLGWVGLGFIGWGIGVVPKTRIFATDPHGQTQTKKLIYNNFFLVSNIFRSRLQGNRI